MTPVYVGAGVCLFVPVLVLLLRKYMAVLVERRIAAYQNDLVARHCGEVENIYR